TRLSLGQLARKNRGIRQIRGELADVFLEPLSLVRHRQARASRRRGFRNRPRNRTLVRYSDNQTRLASEISHDGLVLSSQFSVPSLRPAASGPRPADRDKDQRVLG